MAERQIEFVRNEWGFIEAWNKETGEFSGFISTFGDDIEMSFRYENIVRAGIEAKRVYEEFMKRDKIAFQELKPTTIPDRLSGVYAIFDKILMKPSMSEEQQT